MTTATLVALVRWHRSQLTETNTFISAGATQLFVLSTLQVLPRAAYVSFLASILVSADRLEPHRQWRLVLLAVWVYSLDQRLVSQPLAGHSIHEAVEARQGMVFDVTFVQSEGKFINVAAKMFLAGMMIDAINATLHDRENALNTVRGYIVPDIFALAVIDRIVIEGQASNTDIRAGFVGVDGRANLNILKDRGLDRLRVRADDRHGDRAPAALAHTKNWSLANRATARLELLRLVFVGFLAADECFINLNDASKFLEIGATTSLPQAVQDEPSRLLGNPNFLRQLHRGYALARRHKQVHRVDPLVQRNMAALEYRGGAHRKVFLALVAAIEAASPFGDPLAKPANRAARAVRPQPTFEVGPRLFLVREHLEKLERRNGALGHRSALNFWAQCTREKRGSQVYNSPNLGFSD
jgi:hypothetical protein